MTRKGESRKNKMKKNKSQKKEEVFDLGMHIEESTESSNSSLSKDGPMQMNVPELPLFDFSTLAAATSNFSDENKLQGGFGLVYKGMLPEGNEIAVERLSKSFEKGLEEFKNMVESIAKFPYSNLVRVLGYCIEGEEKLLVYEYMPNESLDAILPD